MSQGTHLVWLSDSPTVATGFGRVAREVVPLLAERLGLEATCLGWRYDRRASVPENFPARVLPQGALGTGRDNLPRLLASPKKAVVVTLGDPWTFAPVARLRDKHDFRWVAYLPTDAGPLPRRAVEYALEADAVVSPSHYGKQVLEAVLPEIEVSVAYHGVDCQVFRPLNSREYLRAAHGLTDRFVVGFVGRNQPRKQLPALIQGFAQFAEHCPEAFLYLHTDADEQGWHIPELLGRTPGTQDHGDAMPVPLGSSRWWAGRRRKLDWQAVVWPEVVVLGLMAWRRGAVAADRQDACPTGGPRRGGLPLLTCPSQPPHPPSTPGVRTF